MIFLNIDSDYSPLYGVSVCLLSDIPTGLASVFYDCSPGFMRIVPENLSMHELSI